MSVGRVVGGDSVANIDCHAPSLDGERLTGFFCQIMYEGKRVIC